VENARREDEKLENKEKAVMQSQKNIYSSSQTKFVVKKTGLTVYV